MEIGIGTFTEMDFDEAVGRTRTALAERGFGILHEIDLTSTLKNKIDKDIERVLILGACNPGFAGAAFLVAAALNLAALLIIAWRTPHLRPATEGAPA